MKAPAKKKPAAGLALKTPRKRGGKGRPFKPGNPGGPGRPRKGDTSSAFMEQALPKEELCRLIATAARRGSIAALRLAAEYTFGKPWSESELIAQSEIARLEKLIAEDKERRNADADQKIDRSSAAGGSVAAGPSRSRRSRPSIRARSRALGTSQSCCRWRTTGSGPMISKVRY